VADIREGAVAINPSYLRPARGREIDRRGECWILTLVDVVSGVILKGAVVGGKPGHRIRRGHVIERCRPRHASSKHEAEHHSQRHSGPSEEAQLSTFAGSFHGISILSDCPAMEEMSGSSGFVTLRERDQRRRLRPSWRRPGRSPQHRWTKAALAESPEQ